MSMFVDYYNGSFYNRINEWNSFNWNYMVMKGDVQQFNWKIRLILKCRQWLCDKMMVFDFKQYTKKFEWTFLSENLTIKLSTCRENFLTQIINHQQTLTYYTIKILTIATCQLFKNEFHKKRENSRFDFYLKVLVPLSYFLRIK